MIEVHRGICRTVFLVGRWAIKVPSTRPYGRRGDRLWAWSRGVLANQSERAWQVDGVAPVLHSILGGIVQVYPRCSPAPIESWMHDRDDPRWVQISGILPAIDRKPQNLGLLGDRLVWVDYDTSWNGCPHQPWIPQGDDA